MSTTTVETSSARPGWRFGIGVGLIIAGYIVLLLIPFVTNWALPAGIKAALTGFFAVAPFLTKVAAVAVMGKPGFNLVKQYVSKFFGRLWPDHVSRARYRFGLILFLVAIIFNLVLPYLPGVLVDWKSNEIFWSLISDVLIIVSLFALGGEFWNKVMALFRYDAKVVVAADGPASVRSS